MRIHTVSVSSWWRDTVTKVTAVFCLVALISSCSSAPEETASNRSAAREAKRELREIHEAMKKVEPFFKPMGEPGPNDWLAHFTEKGQTFDEYLDENPTLPTKERHTIYIQPIGQFTGDQSRVIKLAAGYIEAFYDLPVKELLAKKFDKALQIKDYRTIDYPKHRQVRTGYILDEILKPSLPKDAAALIAFTNEDLYPGDGNMFFVFGQASFEDRVGVYSLYRLDELADKETFLRRTLKIAAHETGHMFSIRHCTKYECVMSGTNHLAETDSRPVDACPECMAKVCWLSDITPIERYRKLMEFCLRNGLKAEAEDFRRKMSVVQE